MLGHLKSITVETNPGSRRDRYRWSVWLVDNNGLTQSYYGFRFSKWGAKRAALAKAIKELTVNKPKEVYKWRHDEADKQYRFGKNRRLISKIS